VNLIVSLVRTGVPALAGWLAALAARYGLGLDAQALTSVLMPVAMFCYYTVFRLAEHYVSPAWGWMLGSPRPPQYDLAA